MLIVPVQRFCRSEHFPKIKSREGSRGREGRRVRSPPNLDRMFRMIHLKHRCCGTPEALAESSQAQTQDMRRNLCDREGHATPARHHQMQCCVSNISLKLEVKGQAGQSTLNCDSCFSHSVQLAKKHAVAEI